VQSVPVELKIRRSTDKFKTVWITPALNNFRNEDAGAAKPVI